MAIEQLVAAAVNVYAWKVSLKCNDPNVDMACEYTANLMALLGVWALWVQFLGPVARGQLPLFCTFVHALQRELVENIGEILLEPDMEVVRPEPNDEENQNFALFCAALKDEIRAGAPLVVDTIMAENDSARVGTFKKLTFSMVPFSARCEEHDAFTVKPLLDLTNSLIRTLINIQHPDSA